MLYNLRKVDILKFYELQTKDSSKTVNQLSLKGIGSLGSEKSYF